MNRHQILSAIRSLACSQGFYGRLLNAIDDDSTILDQLEAQHFSDTVDMVMWIEG